MKIKITENIGPIVNHPNGDISITGEIRMEIVMNPRTAPLKRLVAVANLNGRGYSYDEADIKKR
ncbi:hypothetical protein ACMDB5_13150 [Flavobacterium sp. W1B]|uniref:hypothetical protein n=1 Tax=Flavobacterium sp. W1B TaxID=3394146 RepID=UPI0039BD7EB2